MLQSLKRMLKRILMVRRRKTIQQYYKSDQSTIFLPQFNLRLDHPKKGHKYLEIGRKCIIGGTFVFESNEGEIIVGDNTFIGGSTLISHSKISIGSNVHIAWGCTIYDHDSHSINYLDRRKDSEDQYNCMKNGLHITEDKNWDTVNTRHIIIGDDAWIGMNCIILKGVTIGRGAIVGAGSVVTHDVAAWTVVAGNPISVIRVLPPPV